MPKSDDSPPGPEGRLPGGGDLPGALPGGAGLPGGAEEASAEDDQVWPPVCEERRRLLAALTLGIGAAAGTSLLAPWLALFATPLARTDRAVWRDVGPLEGFPIGETLQVTFRDPAPLPWAGFAARSGAWIRREGPEELSAFTTYCSHVGCAVRWEEGARLFLCPCHGGAFYEDGSVAAGPPPRPLDRHPVRVREGRVEIRAEGIPEPRG